MTDGKDLSHLLVSLERTPYGEFEAWVPPLPHNSLAIHFSGRATLEWHCDASPRIAWPMHGDVTLVSAGRLGLLCVRGGPCEVLKIDIPDASLLAHADAHERSLTTNPLRDCFAAADHLIEQVSLALLDAVEQPGTVDTLYRDALSNALLAHLVRRHAETEVKRDDARRLYALSEPRARRAVAFMEAELSRAIGLDDIARELGLSTSHFAAQFRQSFGRSPARYLTWLRLEYTRELLQRGGVQVKDVAAQVGFISASHFAQAFRSQYGVAPSVFLRENAGGV